MSLQTEIEKFIKDKGLISSDKKILVALSGGIDSMVLLHILQRSNYNCAIAHCNFLLRGKESDEDEEFVRRIARDVNLTSHFKRFQTKEYAFDQKLSIQEAARDLRYKWFNELCDEYRYTKIATAHHLDDNIETILINLQRGTGVKGLRGIMPLRDRIIRPLLQVTKDRVKKYAIENNVLYRNDLSNSDTKYLRNKIRLEVIPALKEADPEFYIHWNKRIYEAVENWELLEQEILKIKEECLVQKGEKTYIEIQKLINKKEAALFLFHLLDGFEFSVPQRIKAVDLLRSSSGKKIIGKNSILLKDRTHLIISPHSKRSPEVIIDGCYRRVTSPLDLKLSEHSIEDVNLIKKPNFAYFDLEKIKFPLKIDQWRKGDAFYPLGMKGKKKLSDLFIDEKVDYMRKREIPIMRSGKEILWVMGIRISDKHKVTSQTNRVLKVEWKNANIYKK